MTASINIMGIACSWAADWWVLIGLALFLMVCYVARCVTEYCCTEDSLRLKFMREESEWRKNH